MSNIIQFPAKKPNKVTESKGERGLLLLPVTRAVPGVGDTGAPGVISIPFKAEHGDLAMKALSGDYEAITGLVQFAKELIESNDKEPA